MELKTGMWLRCFMDGQDPVVMDKWYRIIDIDDLVLTVEADGKTVVYPRGLNPFDLANPAYGAPFDLEQALAGAKLVTAGGSPVENFRPHGAQNKPYVADVRGVSSLSRYYNADGTHRFNRNFNLLIAEYATSTATEPIVGKFVKCLVGTVPWCDIHFTVGGWYEVLGFADKHYKLLTNNHSEIAFPADSPLFDWNNSKTADELGATQKIETPESILQEAERLINGDREADYGSVADNFNRIAMGWSQIFNTTVTAEQVGLAMAWLKIARQVHKPKRDNLVDACGYLGLVEKLNK